MHIEIKSDKTKYIVIINHNITNRSKEHTTEPCLHAPAVSMTNFVNRLLFKYIY